MGGGPGCGAVWLCLIVEDGIGGSWSWVQDWGQSVEWVMAKWWLCSGSGCVLWWRWPHKMGEVGGLLAHSFGQSGGCEVVGCLVHLFGQGEVGTRWWLGNETAGSRCWHLVWQLFIHSRGVGWGWGLGFSVELRCQCLIWCSFIRPC